MLPEGNTSGPLMFLVSALTSEDAEVRKGARDALLVQGAEPLPVLHQLLANPDRKLRIQAARILAESGSSEGGEILAAFLDDEYTEVRRQAVDGLISRGRRAVVPVLHELITHAASPRVRAAAARVFDACVQREHMDAVQPVLTALKDGAPVFDVPFTAYRVLDSILNNETTEGQGSAG